MAVSSSITLYFKYEGTHLRLSNEYGFENFWVDIDNGQHKSSNSREFLTVALDALQRGNVLDCTDVRLGNNWPSSRLVILKTSAGL